MRQDLEIGSDSQVEEVIDRGGDGWVVEEVTAKSRSTPKRTTNASAVTCDSELVGYSVLIMFPWAFGL